MIKKIKLFLCMLVVCIIFSVTPVNAAVSYTSTVTSEMAWNTDSLNTYCAYFTFKSKLSYQCVNSYVDINVNFTSSVSNPTIELSYSADNGNSVKINMTKLNASSYTAKLPLYWGLLGTRLDVNPNYYQSVSGYNGKYFPLVVKVYSSNGSLVESTTKNIYFSAQNKQTLDKFTSNGLDSRYQKDWQIIGVADPLYNCLSYSINVSNKWTWPWNGNPILDSMIGVDQFLKDRGYLRTSNVTEAKIIVYGNKNGVTHFARRQTDGTYNAKIGYAEVLKHKSYSPYNVTQSNDITYYGPAIAYYK